MIPGHQEPLTKQRLHVTFGKYGALRYTSNLDLAKVWERTLRRAKLPLLYSQGFNTRPRIQLASALPLGITSECEILDISLKERISLNNFIETISMVSPDGLRLYAVVEVPIKSPALQTLVQSADYRIQFDQDIDRERLQQRIKSILDLKNIFITKTRKNKKTAIDLRPMIHSLTLDENGDLIAHIAAGDRGNVRLEDLINELLPEQNIHYNAHRFRLYLDE